MQRRTKNVGFLSFCCLFALALAVALALTPVSYHFLLLLDLVIAAFFPGLVLSLLFAISHALVRILSFAIDLSTVFATALEISFAFAPSFFLLLLLLSLVLALDLV